MNKLTKTIFDGGKVRMLVDDYSILVEEFPRTPRQTTLRSTRISTSYAVTTLRCDDFIPANLLRGFPLNERDTYDVVNTMLRNVIELVMKAPGNAQVARYQGVSIQTEERHYLKVVPEGAEPREVVCADFVLSTAWTKFSAYSPNSDFQQAVPHYTEIASKSAGAARKLYKLAVTADMAKVTWNTFPDWLKTAEIAFDYNFSQWT